MPPRFKLYQTYDLPRLPREEIIEKLISANRNTQIGI